MGKFMRACCRRETYAMIIGIIFCIFEIMALATPWYAIGATQMPKPWDSMSGVFYWGGFEGLYSPPLVNNQRTYGIGWSDMSSKMPKDVYMTSMAMSFLALFAMLLLIGLLFFGFILPATERVVKLMFFGYFKWIAVLVCFVVWGLSLISWTIFFAFNNALSHADMCPGSTHYNPPPFPYNNDTIWFEPLWCDSFANNRLSYDAARYVWGPSIGWIFALIGYVLSNVVLFIMLTVPTRQKEEYTRIK